MTTSRRLRGTVLTLGAVAVTMSLAACGGSTAPGGGSGASVNIDLGSGPPKAGTVKAGALKGTTLTFVSYGGIYQDGQNKAALEPFAKESGAKIVQDGPTDNSKITTQVQSGNVSWNIIDTTNVFTAEQCGTLFEPLDTSIVDTSKIPAGAVTDKCSVPAMGYGLVLVYNTKKYGTNPPKSWADYYDTKKFPGKRGLQGSTSDVDAGVLEGALLADGVAADKIYPLDVKRALAKMTTIRSDSKFWTTGAEAQQQLESGQVDMSMLWSGRAYTAIKNGASYKAIWDQWMPEADVLAVPKGDPNAKASFAAINYYLGAEQQTKLTELTSYSPVNVDSKPKLDQLGQSFLTTTPERQATMFKIDLSWWAKNHKDVVQQWSNWLAG